MREAACLSRRAAAALPLAVLIGPAAATLPAIAAIGADAALLDLGRRYAASWSAVFAHDAVPYTSMSYAEIQTREDIGEQLHHRAWALTDEVMASPAHTLAGLTLKAQATARAHDVVICDVEHVEIALAASADIETHAALALSLAVLKLRSGGDGDVRIESCCGQA